MNLKNYILNPKKILEVMVRNKIPGCIFSDKMALSILYMCRFGKKIDFQCPKTFNEKILWLSVYDRKPIYSTMADKFRAKEYISSIIGDGYVPQNLGVWKTTSAIDFTTLPKKFVLKCNHDSGSVIVCDNKIPDKKVLAALDKNLKKNYYWFSREWPYKNIKPCIFAEEYIEGLNDKETGLIDYKFYCFNGIPQIICVISNRNTNARLTFLDMSWKKLKVKQRYDNHETIPPKPKEFEKMFDFACKLSRGIRFIRIDFFEDYRKRIFVGELTFTPSSGLIGFTPEEFDYKLGEYLKI